MTRLERGMLICPAAGLAILGWLPPRPHSTRLLARQVAEYWGKHPDQASALARSAGVAAHENGVKPTLVLSVLLVEGYFRPRWLQRAEYSLWVTIDDIFSVLGIRPPDSSLGPAQIRLSTAAWIAGLGSCSPLKRDAHRPRLLAQLLMSPDVAARVAAHYLAVLERAGSGRPSQTRHTTLAIVASRYRGGVPWSRPVPSRYGVLVSAVAATEFVRSTSSVGLSASEPVP